MFTNEEDVTDIQATIEGPGMKFKKVTTMYSLPSAKCSCLLSDRFICRRCTGVLDLCSCFVAGTPYEGGLFRVKLVLGKDFPTAPPKGEILLTKVRIS